MPSNLNSLFERAVCGYLQEQRSKSVMQALKTVEDCLLEIDLATGPSRMSSRKALEFLKQCVAGLEERIAKLTDY